MKLISWNVNGIRACIGKGFEESFAALDADIFCLQETKCQQGQVKLELPGYYQYWNYANRRGYSGTAVFTKKEPLSVAYGIGIEEHDKEGRVITLEYEKFYLVTVYTPNSQSELRRLEYRMQWEEDFLAYLLKLQESKPVICCGDFNVAHQEIDLKNPKTNRKNAGFCVSKIWIRLVAKKHTKMQCTKICMRWALYGKKAPISAVRMDRIANQNVWVFTITSSNSGVRRDKCTLVLVHALVA